MALLEIEMNDIQRTDTETDIRIRVYLNQFLFLDTNVSFNFQFPVNNICSFEIFST